MNDDNPGWFKIAGLQDGKVDLDRQIRGLEIVRAECKDARVLDLGCAEGLISLEMAKSGACLIHGLELETGRVEVAQSLFATQFPNLQTKFVQWDLNRFANFFVTRTADSEWSDIALLTRYEVVLCLAIAQKLINPSHFLRLASAMCENIMAIRLPFPIIDDHRSRHKPVDVKRLLSVEFELIQETELYPKDVTRPYTADDDGWLGVFRRRR